MLKINEGMANVIGSSRTRSIHSQWDSVQKSTVLNYYRTFLGSSELGSSQRSSFYKLNILGK